jgi:hypothetical protein
MALDGAGSDGCRDKLRLRSHELAKQAPWNRSPRFDGSGNRNNLLQHRVGPLQWTRRSISTPTIVRGVGLARPGSMGALGRALGITLPPVSAPQMKWAE